MATRFYLPSSGSAAVSPAFDAAWEITSAAVRRATPTTPGGSSLTDERPYSTDSNDANRDYLSVQFVSEPIAAQTIAAQTLEFQIQGREWAGTNNGNMMTAIGVRVVSNDGSTVRGTILAVSRDATEMDDAATLENRRFTATTTQVVAQDGDRIVIEIGAGGDPDNGTGNHDYTLRFGDGGAGGDLPENDTSTATNLNPWLEFPNDITFAGAGGGEASRAMQQYRQRRVG